MWHVSVWSFHQTSRISVRSITYLTYLTSACCPAVNSISWFWCWAIFADFNTHEGSEFRCSDQETIKVRRRKLNR